MKKATGRAPSKLILLGEHSVVYGHPAIAVPLNEPGAEAVFEPADPAGPAVVALEDFQTAWAVGTPEPSGEARPFARLVSGFIEKRGAPDRGWRLTVRSKVPIGCGLGSGAAVSAAALRALCGAFEVKMDADELSKAVYETEKIFHGTPSGIDNTVVSVGRPVLFRKGQGFELLDGPAAPLQLVVGDTGVRHRTVEVVSDVRRARDAQPGTFDALFKKIGEITLRGAEAFRQGDAPALGRLLIEDQACLGALGVSSPVLERLITAARDAGALGAKLSGAGRGGCMFALADGPEGAERVKKALSAAGAEAAFVTGIRGTESCARS